MKTTRFGANTFRNRPFLQPVALRRGYDFGMVPADLRPPFWAGRACFLSAGRNRGRDVGTFLEI